MPHFPACCVVCHDFCFYFHHLFFSSNVCRNSICLSAPPRCPSFIDNNRPSVICESRSSYEQVITPPPFYTCYDYRTLFVVALQTMAKNVGKQQRKEKKNMGEKCGVRIGNVVYPIRLVGTPPFTQRLLHVTSFQCVPTVWGTLSVDDTALFKRETLRGFFYFSFFLVDDIPQIGHRDSGSVQGGRKRVTEQTILNRPERGVVKIYSKSN